MSLRTVILTGTAQLNILVGNVGSYEQTVKGALDQAGFSINSVRMTKGGLSTFTNNIGITVDSNVSDQYTAEQQRAAVQQALSNIAGESYAYYGSNLLSDVSLQILSDGGSNTTNTDTTTKSDLDAVLKNVGNAAKDIAKDAAKGAASNLATPIAIGGICVLLLLLYAPRGK